MGDTTENIRVVISATAEELRKAFTDAKGDVGSFTAALKAIPDRIKIGIQVDDVDARSKLGRLATEAKSLQALIARNTELGLSTRKSVSELREVERAIDSITRAEARAALAARAMGANTDRGSGLSLTRLKDVVSGREILGGGGSNPLASVFQDAGRTAGGGGGGGAGGVFGGGAGAAVGGVAAGTALAGPILGAGALATSAAGVVGVGGLLPLLTLAKPALGGVQELSKALTNLQQVQELYGKNQPALTAAQNRYTAAVTAFGPNSRAAIAAHNQLILAQHQAANSAPQVVAAQMAVNKLMLESDQPARQLALAFSQLDSTFNDAGLKIIPQISRVLTPLISVFTTALLPTLVKMANIDLSGIATGLKPLEDMMKGQAFQGMLLQLAHLFAQGAPIFFEQLKALMLIFLRTAIDAGPALIHLGAVLAGVLDRVAAFLATAQGKQFIDEMVQSFLAWGKALLPLTGALLHLAIALVPTFTDLVIALTPALGLLAGAINQVAEFLHSKLGQALLGVALFPLKLAIDVLVGALHALGDIIGWVAHAWSDAWSWIRSNFGGVIDFILGGFSSLLGVLKDMASAFDWLPVVGGALKDFEHHVGDAQHTMDGFRRTMQPTGDAASMAATQISHAFAKASGSVKANFADMASYAGKSLHDIELAALVNMVQIQNVLGTKSLAAREALSHNFLLAAADIRASMAAGVISTKKGLAEINALMARALRGLGVPVTTSLVGTLQDSGAGLAASALSGGAPSFAPGSPQHGTTYAVGGWIGRPGEKGRDEIGIVVGRGEAVLNDTQQGIVNEALARTGMRGGLHDVFRATAGSLHYMAGGGFAGGGWVRTGATLDPTQGQPSAGSGPHGGFSFAELLEAGANAGMRPDLTQLLGLPRGAYGMPMGTAIDVRAPGSKRSFQIWKNDVGSGQRGDAHFTIDLHQAISDALGGITRSDVEVALAGTDPNAAVTAAGGALAALKTLKAPRWTGPGGQLGQIGRAVLARATAAANQKLSQVAPAGGGPGGPSTLLPGGHVAGRPYGALTPGRVDQGFDFGGAGPVGAVDAGTVLRNTIWPGWPGSGGVVYSTPQGNVYVMEDFAASVRVGQHLTLGDIVGRALGGSSGIETGWANATGTGPLTPYNGAPDGTPMPGGLAFKRFLGYAGGGFAGMLRAAAGKKPAKSGAKGGKKPGRNPRQHARPLTLADRLARWQGAFQNLPDVSNLPSVGDPFDKLTGALDNQESLLTTIEGQTNPDGSQHLYLTPDDLSILGPTMGIHGPAGLSTPTLASGQLIFDDETANRQTAIAVLTAKVKALADFGSLTSTKPGSIGVAVKERQDREDAIKAYLTIQLRRATMLKEHLAKLKSSSLQTRLRAARDSTARALRIQATQDSIAALQGLKRAERARGPAANVVAIQGYDRQIAQEQATLRHERRGTGAAVGAAQVAVIRDGLQNQVKGIDGVLTTFGGSTTRVGTGGVIGQIDSDLKTLLAAGADFQTQISDITTSGIPNLRLDLRNIADNKTSVGAQAGSSTPTGPDLAALNQLLGQQLQASYQALAVSQSQYATLAGFAPLLQGRLVGSFASGIDFVPQTGLALVHRGETITPDPGGPYGNRAAAEVHAAQQPLELTVVLGNNDEPLMKVIRAELNGHALRVVSDHAGQRARLMAGVRRG